jgi:hypothetical protein
MPIYANLPTRDSSCWFPGDIISNPFCFLYSHQLNTGELLSVFVVFEFQHQPKNARMCVIMISFSQPGFMDQMCSQTPLFGTNKMDIRGFHSTAGHCYLQYSQLYSASFEITNWIDNLFITILCSHTMSTSESPPKTHNMAPLGWLFGSQ